MFTVWHELFSMVLMFPGMRIEALPPSTVQGKCISTFFKAENQEIQLLLLCNKPSKYNKFLSFKGRYSRADLLALYPSEYYQFGQFFSLTCHNSQKTLTYFLLELDFTYMTRLKMHPQLVLRQNFFKYFIRYLQPLNKPYHQTKKQLYYYFCNDFKL